MKATTVLILTVAAFSAAGGQLLFKVGARGRDHIIGFLNLYIGGGVFLYGAGTLIWIYALSTQKLVTVYAFTALTFVLVYIGGVLLLGEDISRPAMLGVVLVLGGLYLITVKSV